MRSHHPASWLHSGSFSSPCPSESAYIRLRGQGGHTQGAMKAAGVVGQAGERWLRGPEP